MKKILTLEDDIELLRLLNDKIDEEVNGKNCFESTFLNNSSEDYNFQDFKKELWSIKSDIEFNFDDFNDEESYKKAVIEAAKKRNDFFEKIIEKYNDVNIYIVDIELKSRANDILGIEFINFLLKRNIPYDFIYILSSNTSAKNKISRLIDEEKIKIIDKVDDLKFLDTIANDLKIKLYKKNTNKELDSNESNEDNSKWSMNKSLIKSFNNLYSKRNRYLDFIISLFFKSAIMVSVIFSSFHIFKEVKSDFFKQTITQEINEIKKLDSILADTYILNYPIIVKKINSKKSKILNGLDDGDYDDSKTLKFIEHLFLYLIPLFIIFGFYSYYKYDFRRRLLKAIVFPDEIKSAKESIILTKTLFLTSIMSYIIIKIIEKLFIEKETKLEQEQLISFGVLLLLIMVYLIITHRKDH